MGGLWVTAEEDGRGVTAEQPQQEIHWLSCHAETVLNPLG